MVAGIGVIAGLGGVLVARTVGLEEVAGEKLGDIAAGVEEGLASDGGADRGKLGDVLDEAPDALQAARQQAPYDICQALPLLPPPLLRPATHQPHSCSLAIQLAVHQHTSVSIAYLQRQRLLGLINRQKLLLRHISLHIGNNAVTCPSRH